jgi:hypothetical protein
MEAANENPPTVPSYLKHGMKDPGSWIDPARVATFIDRVFGAGSKAADLVARPQMEDVEQ